MSALSLILLLLAAALVWGWIADRHAAERATDVARRTCQQAGVVWLDQNAQLVRRRLGRTDQGRLTWERTFEFEYASTLDERQRGRVVLRDNRVVQLLGPQPPATVYTGQFGSAPDRPAT